MPTFKSRRRVVYSPRQMFDLVADVEQYPQFLPLCEDLRVERRDVKDGHTLLVARMWVGYGALRESFKTEVQLMPDEFRVVVRHLDGPFHSLENRWHFEAVAGGCDVDFYIAYEFRSVMLGLVMGAMFDRAFRKFAEAFEARARVVYGVSGGALEDPA